MKYPDMDTLARKLTHDVLERAIDTGQVEHADYPDLDVTDFHHIVEHARKRARTSRTGILAENASYARLSAAADNSEVQP